MDENSTPSEEFSDLPITCPPQPSWPREEIHHVYLRRNMPRITTADDPRSLFLKNVPVDSTEPHFRAVFTALIGAGRFEGITFERDKKTVQTSHEPPQAARIAKLGKRRREEEEAENKRLEEAARLPDTWTRKIHKSGSSAVVLLADDKSVDAVFKALKKLQKNKKYPVWGEAVEDKVSPLGFDWIMSHYKLTYPGNDVVKKAMDAYFTLYNNREKEAERLAKKLRNEPDEDGFVTVTRGGRSAPANRHEAEEARQKMLEKQQRKNGETQDFYRFQLRERQKAEQNKLLQGFDEDRRKVEAMKEKRRFRPES